MRRTLSNSSWKRTLVAGAVILALACGVPLCSAEETEEDSSAGWLTDYAAAYEQAENQQKLLVVHFQSDKSQSADELFIEKTLQDDQIQRLLESCVCVRVNVSQPATINGQSKRLIDHEAFAHMQGKPGIAVIDLANFDRAHYRRTVSVLPFESPAYNAPAAWSAASLRVLLELPAGTLTQRTLIYAVRCHSEKPACTCARCDAVLAAAASSHSNHQANIHLQGHHNWDARFQRIYAQIGGTPPTEVCAESWGGEPLVKAAFSCVHSWRQSQAHWSAVSAKQPAYGFDIARGSNGVWYATGIFGGS